VISTLGRLFKRIVPPSACLRFLQMFQRPLDACRSGHSVGCQHELAGPGIVVSVAQPMCAVRFSAERGHLRLGVSRCALLTPRFSDN
jgi:hypothetical protein